MAGGSLPPWCCPGTCSPGAGQQRRPQLDTPRFYEFRDPCSDSTGSGPQSLIGAGVRDAFRTNAVTAATSWRRGRLSRLSRDAAGYVGGGMVVGRNTARPDVVAEVADHHPARGSSRSWVVRPAGRTRGGDRTHWVA